jgi:hypothetical protein
MSEDHRQVAWIDHRPPRTTGRGLSISTVPSARASTVMSPGGVGTTAGPSRGHRGGDRLAPPFAGFGWRYAQRVGDEVPRRGGRPPMAAGAAGPALGPGRIGTCKLHSPVMTSMTSGMPSRLAAPVLLLLTGRTCLVPSGLSSGPGHREQASPHFGVPGIAATGSGRREPGRGDLPAFRRCREAGVGGNGVRHSPSKAPDANVAPNQAFAQAGGRFREAPPTGFEPVPPP